MFRSLCVLTFACGMLGLLGTAEARPDDSKLKFELYKDKADEFRWRLKAANGAVLATPGQGYKAKADAKNSIEVVKKAATDAKITFEVYEDGKKEHRWRLKAANGQIVANSSEGYKSKADAEKAAQLIKDGAPKAEVVEIDK